MTPEEPLRVADRKRVLVEYKGGECSRCGWKHAGDEGLAVYDFHHVKHGTKSFAIGRGMNSRRWGVLISEVDKCVMLCANCHRIHHGASKRGQTSGRPRGSGGMWGADDAEVLALFADVPPGSVWPACATIAIEVGMATHSVYQRVRRARKRADRERE